MSARVVLASLVLLSTLAATRGYAMSVIFLPRVNLDPCPTSPLVQEANYPAFVTIQDGWAAPCRSNDGGNINLWRVSEDGVTPLRIENSDAFIFSADLRLSGHGGIASLVGLQVGPFGCVGTDDFGISFYTGSVGAGGRQLPRFYFDDLDPHPFYSLGETIHLEIRYNPNGLSQSDPAMVEYIVIHNGHTYQSGPLQCTSPAGLGCGAQIGGYLQLQFQGGPATSMLAEWRNIIFIRSVSVVPTSWSRVRALYR